MMISQNNRFDDLQYSHLFGGIVQCFLKTANDTTSLYQSSIFSGLSDLFGMEQFKQMIGSFCIPINVLIMQKTHLLKNI